MFLGKLPVTLSSAGGLLLQQLFHFLLSEVPIFRRRLLFRLGHLAVGFRFLKGVEGFRQRPAFEIGHRPLQPLAIRLQTLQSRGVLRSHLTFLFTDRHTALQLVGKPSDLPGQRSLLLVGNGVPGTPPGIGFLHVLFGLTALLLRDS